MAEVQRNDDARPDKSVPPLTLEEITKRAEQMMFNRLMKMTEPAAEREYGTLGETLKKVNVNCEDVYMAIEKAQGNSKFL